MSQKTQWQVYIVETECGKLYTGISTDIERRFSEHCQMYESKSGPGAKYFRGHKPRTIIWSCSTQGRSEASSIEFKIKKMSSRKKRELISGDLELSLDE